MLSLRFHLRQIRRQSAVLLLLLFASGSSFAADGLPLHERYPSGSIAAPESAREALAAVAAERMQIQSRFEEEERSCQKQFFVNRCLDQAKERRRQALAPLSVLEIDANRYLRQDRARQRDMALEERRVRAEAEAARPVRARPDMPTPKRQEPAEQSSVQPRVQSASVAVAAPRTTRIKSVRPAPSAEQALAEKRERDLNVAAYERKVQAARERQESVARKKAEKERARVERARSTSVSSN